MFWSIFILIFFAFIGFSSSNRTIESPVGTSPSPTQQVLSQATESYTEENISPTPKLSKQSYTIAVYGDSMIDTMGDGLPYLDKALSEKYPGVKFTLYNYGIGAQNVSDGYARFQSPYVYKERNYPPITQIGADVIILGTFAYNPFSSHDRNRHYREYSQLVEQAKQTSSSIYILVEIAPLGNTFGKGKNGINWPPDLARTQALHIIEQLENGISVGKTQGVPVIDTFHMTQLSGQFGEASYVNPDDGIHPSVAGHTFIAEQIVEAIHLR